MTNSKKEILNLDNLSKVIKRRVGVNDDAARDLALRLLNYFGFGTSIIDNCLDQEDRRLFYFLQDLKLLKTHWEESILPNGRGWRIFYWDLNEDEIARELGKISKKAEEPVELYDSLPAEAWTRESTAETA